MNYLNQSTNQNNGSAGRCQGLFPPHPQSQGKAPWGQGWYIVPILTFSWLNVTYIAKLDYPKNSPVHETLALSVHWPPDPQRANEGPCSWYPCGHVNKHFELIFISEVTQSFGEAFTGRLIIRAGQFPGETRIELKYCKDVRLVGVVYIYRFISK